MQVEDILAGLVGGSARGGMGETGPGGHMEAQAQARQVGQVGHCRLALHATKAGASQPTIPSLLLTRA